MNYSEKKKATRFILMKKNFFLFQNSIHAANENIVEKFLNENRSRVFFLYRTQKSLITNFPREKKSCSRRFKKSCVFSRTKKNRRRNRKDLRDFNAFNTKLETKTNQRPFRPKTH